jgi:hypothetical protein
MATISSTLGRLTVTLVLLGAVAGCAAPATGRSLYASLSSEAPRLPPSYPCQNMHVKTLNCPSR